MSTSFLTRSTRPQPAVGSEAAPQGAVSAFRAYIYIDGFNVYKRLLSKTPYKWLDLRLFAQRLLGNRGSVVRVNFYTSNVSGKLNPRMPGRQNQYLRAIKAHIAELQVHLGKFNTKAVLRPKSKPLPSGKWDYVQVLDTKEKGSDVNIASHLLRDAFQDSFDLALVISQDTDLIEPVRIAVQDAHKVVGVACPERVPEGMRREASFALHIHRSILKACQLPATVRKEDGEEIHKPSAWNNEFGF